jgi:hypothetical protein
MATRRIKSTLNNHYVQPLKFCTKTPLIITPSSSYNSILLTKKHKSCILSTANKEMILWAKFKTLDFDGINLIAFINKENKKKTIGSCNFKLFSVSTDDNWDEVLIHEELVTNPGKSAKLHIPQAILGSFELDGEFTVSVEAEIKIRDKTYKKKIYVNHLGVYDSIFRLQQDVEFLDITKVDE